ncbi:MAG: response regulator [Anaerolineales bacterium]
MGSPLNALQDWRVLIVDDHFDNIIVAQTTLEHYGAQIYIAENGEAGLALLGSICPHLILMDLSMPMMNGWELIAHIREHRPDLADVPIIAVTAHAMHGDREKALAVGFDGYIAKPYDIHDLVPAILDVIASKEGSGGNT